MMTVMSTVLADRQVILPIDYEKIASQFPAPSIQRQSGNGPYYGTMSRITQIVDEIKHLPNPYASLAIHGLEEHWDKLSKSADKSADQLSNRHRYPSGILAHLWSVLKVLRFIFQGSNPIKAMEDITRKLKQERELSDYAVTGVESFALPQVASIEYLDDIIRMTHRAIDSLHDLPSYTNCIAGAVFTDIGKLVTEADVSPCTFGAECLIELSIRNGMSFEEIASVHEIVAVPPNPNASYPFLPDAWILLFASYLADKMG